jgi:hypothetical protein
MDGRLLSEDLLRRMAEDNRLTQAAQRLTTSPGLRTLAACRAENAAALRATVGRQGWPTASAVGEDASTAALMILLHADDLPFQLACRDLITEAVDGGRCPAIHAAYVVDHCAVALGQPQTYGTRYTPQGRPHPIHDAAGVDARRREIGLRTMADEQQALREVQMRHTNRTSPAGCGSGGRLR